MGLLDRAGNVTVNAEPGSPQPGSFEEEIIRYHKINPVFNCVLLEIPASSGGEDKADFCQKVSGMINKIGSVIPLPSGRPLILLPSSIDRELIAHRLSKSLAAMPLLSFEAASPESVLNNIRSMI